jgi:hypothetical protein
MSRTLAALVHPGRFVLLLSVAVSADKSIVRSVTMRRDKSPNLDRQVRTTLEQPFGRGCGHGRLRSSF